MPSDLVQPGTKRLELSEGRWISVKRKLNAGEHYDLMAACLAPRADPRDPPQPDPIKAPLELVLAYLIAWNLTDDDGAVIPLAPPLADDADVARARRSALRAIDFEVFTEILTVIAGYDATQRQKKLSRPASASPAISPSPAAVVGAMNG